MSPGAAAAPVRRRSKLVRYSWYVLFNLIVVIAVNRVVHWRWYGRLVARARPPWQTLQQMAERNRIPVDVAHAIGIANRDERDDLALRPFAHPGRIRIGALGDSFTYGEEVMPGRDYPSRLQAQFKRAGYDNVEVVNFATGWIGLSQITILWERLAQKYDLDFVLLGPQGFYLDREETFNHAVDPEPYYIHGRYILDGADGVRFVEPAGEYSFEDRFAQYFAFIPHWRYLRYDRRAPAFLQSWLPRGKVLANPFYYTSDSPEKERDELFRRLFVRYEKGARQTIVVNNEPEISPLLQNVGPKLTALDVTLPTTFPYRRPRGHMSGTGNDLLASIFFDLLTARAESSPELLEFADPPAAPPAAPIKLADYWRIEAYFAGQPAAYLVHPHGDEVVRGMELDGVVEPDVEKLNSILILRGSKSILDGAFYSMPAPVAPGAKLELEIRGGGAPRRVPLGVAQSVAGQPALAVVDVPGFGTRCFAQTTCIYFDDAPYSEVHSGALLLGGKPLFDVNRADEHSLAVTPIGLERLLLTPLSTDILDMTKLPATGDVTLEFIGRAPRSLRVATWSRRARTFKGKPAARHIGPPVRGQAAIVGAQP